MVRICLIFISLQFFIFSDRKKNSMGLPVSSSQLPITTATRYLVITQVQEPQSPWGTASEARALLAVSPQEQRSPMLSKAAIRRAQHLKWWVLPAVDLSEPQSLHLEHERRNHTFLIIGLRLILHTLWTKVLCCPTLILAEVTWIWLRGPSKVLMTLSPPRTTPRELLS